MAREIDKSSQKVGTPGYVLLEMCVNAIEGLPQNTLQVERARINMFIFQGLYRKLDCMKTRVTKYTCPVCKSPIWETIYEDNSSENGYACYWGHVFTQDELLLTKKYQEDSVSRHTPA